MRKYLTPPFWFCMVSIVALGLNIVFMANGIYSEGVAALVTRLIMVGVLAVVALLYKLRPDWVPTTIKAQAKKDREEERRRAQQTQKQGRPTPAPLVDDERSGPRRPSGW